MRKSTLGFIVVVGNIIGLVGLIYYSVPGYPHLFAMGNPASVQPTALALSAILFCISFVKAVQLTPNKITCSSCKHQNAQGSRFCSQCGIPIVIRSLQGSGPRRSRLSVLKEEKETR